MPDNTPRSFLGWLGRQVGFVKNAIKTDVKPSPKVVYRVDNVEEVPHPQQPNMMLRRTTIDEVVEQPPDAPDPSNDRS